MGLLQLWKSRRQTVYFESRFGRDFSALSGSVRFRTDTRGKRLLGYLQASGPVWTPLCARVSDRLGYAARRSWE